MQAYLTKGALCNILPILFTPFHVLSDVGDSASSPWIAVIGVADGGWRLLSRVGAAHSIGSLHHDESRANVLLAFLIGETSEEGLQGYGTL